MSEFLLQESSGGSEWATLGEPFKNPAMANGQLGSLKARNPNKQFRVIPAPKPKVEPSRDNPDIGAICARLWLDGKETHEIDKHVARVIARVRGFRPRPATTKLQQRKAA